MGYEEMAFDIVRKNSAMPGEACAIPSRVQVIGQIAPDTGVSDLAESGQVTLDEVLQDDALTSSQTSRRALTLIATHCLNEEQLRATRPIRRMLLHSDPIDPGAYDADAMAFAMVEEYFDARRAPFHAPKKWIPTPTGLGYVDEPRYHTVRRVPVTWLCVVLAAYGIACEVVRVLSEGGARRERLQLYCPWKLSEGAKVRLNRDVLRQLYLATLPVIVVQPESAVGPRTICGACVVVPHFSGLDAIIAEENLATFGDLLRLRAAADAGPR
ncbi:hypothetical protein [Trinickia mobilis]|uniref:hypothetical protein n=1 Tax=Trinickia mobilis TaxID=2816356 RepID=UPI001A8E742E|nr:hypothetical protein [Trinickia mobilis]